MSASGAARDGAQGVKTPTSGIAITTKGRKAWWWFNIAVGCWVGFMLVAVATARAEKLTATNLVPIAIIDGLVLVLAVYISRGLATGRRLVGAIGFLCFMAVANLGAVAISLTRLEHDSVWLIPVSLGVVLCVVSRAFWAVIAAYLEKPTPNGNVARDASVATRRPT